MNATESLTVISIAPPAEEVVAPPCYFSNVCAQRAVMEKAGRAVCQGCSANLRGFEYPLRGPSPEPLYLSARAAAEAMNIVDD